MAPAPFVRVESIDYEAWSLALAQAQSSLLQRISPCEHCWHSPRVWQGPLPVPRHCCWCGVHEGPQHGPYAESY